MLLFPQKQVKIVLFSLSVFHLAIILYTLSDNTAQQIDLHGGRENEERKNET